MYILGLSCYYHDAAACLLKDGRIIAAASEERFTRRKADPSFPRQALSYVFAEAGIDANQLDAVGFYDKPLLKFERILTTYIDAFPRGFLSFQKAMPIWLKQKLWIPREIRRELGWKRNILFADHHMSHACSSFLLSPFEEAAVLTVDGVGEWATTTIGHGRGNRVEILRQIDFPHSLGLLYSAFTYYLGFKVNSAEYKVMGLAPYGEPRYLDQVREVIDLHEDGGFALNMEFFEFDWNLRMTGRRLEELLGRPRRRPESKLEQFHMDVAASVQRVTEEVMLRLVDQLHRETGLDNLCLAGGVALNCVANGRILRESPFSRFFVQPAAGDAGGAVGIAYYIWNTLLEKPRGAALRVPYFGPGFDDAEIESLLQRFGAKYRRVERDELIATAAEWIEAGKVVGWFQGRMEFGPRALGNRSILGDARSPEMQRKINLAIKFREGFRPFAPSVLEERCADWFELDEPSPHMLLVAPVRRDRRTIPAVTHVDGSARIQTVAREDNPLYYDLIAEFERRTGCPLVVNTSFNVRGEPIVCTPEEAYRCFMRTHMERLCIGSFLLEKEEQPPLSEEGDWRREFELD
jgi:carbamoyltransferase